MCKAEQSHAKPRWEEWIIAESSRRALYEVYMFDTILSARDGLPTYLGTELSGLPAPSSANLWRAKTRQVWDIEYIQHLAKWPDLPLRLDELWPMPESFDEDAIAAVRSRVDRWLINIDEYGMMLYTVTSCTHGT